MIKQTEGNHYPPEPGGTGTGGRLQTKYDQLQEIPFSKIQTKVHEPHTLKVQIYQHIFSMFLESIKNDIILFYISAWEFIP